MGVDAGGLLAVAPTAARGATSSEVANPIPMRGYSARTMRDYPARTTRGYPVRTDVLRTGMAKRVSLAARRGIRDCRRCC